MLMFVRHGPGISLSLRVGDVRGPMHSSSFSFSSPTPCVT